MLFEKQLGELLLTPTKKLLNQPIKHIMFISVYGSYILTFLNDSSIPHSVLLKNVKEYLAGWEQFITTYDSSIINILSLICFSLLAFKVVNLFQGESSELYDFRLYRWLEIYIDLSIFYAGILVLIEPSFASFFTHLDTNYYGVTETFSILIGVSFTLISFGHLAIKLLRNEGLL